jgi:uncharacterized protein (DUF2252 family)
MPNILISYRRADSDAVTGRIFDRLIAHYGRDSVFRDVDNIPLGVDFRSYIAEILDKSNIVLVVVGTRWSGGKPGKRRIDDPTDTVRIEVEAALRRDIPVIPVLVGRLSMPRADQLPDSLKALTYRNGLRIDTGRDFDYHVGRLIREMDQIFAEAFEPQHSPDIAKNIVDTNKHPTSVGESVSVPAPVGKARPAVSVERAGKMETHAQVPLSSLAEWKPIVDRRDPVQILLDQSKRVFRELLPIRYARMRPDAFSFFRGAAAVMAADLGSMPATGLRVQSCGDCHLANFGAFASPEGAPVFDINDFDETLPAPFEWDVKRLATSLVVAGQVARLPKPECRNLAQLAAHDYRRFLARLARMPPLEIRSVRIDLASAIADLDSRKLRRNLEKRLATIMKSSEAHFGLLQPLSVGWRIKEKPPLVRHLNRHELRAREVIASYANTLQEDTRVLLQRYHLRDVAFKTVGIGSVGIFCAIALFVSEEGAPLFLEVKNAEDSVLAPYAGASQYDNHGQRIVIGQRMLQATTDIFLGWTETPIDGRYFYVQRLKDSRLADVGTRLEAALPFYAALCGRTLARAHAQRGDVKAIAAYMGDSEEFDKSMAEFAVSYADQTDRDWNAFVNAIATGPSEPPIS